MDTNYDTRPIGIFDSGVGGLTVLQELAKSFPDENFLYLGDTARVPYGSKSARTVERYTIQVAEFLLQRGVKALVAACNTASALGLPALRAYCRTPVLGVIQPGCRAALAALANNIVLQDKIGQDKIGQDKIGQDKIGQDKIGQDKIGQGKIGQGKIGVIGTRSTTASGMYPHVLALLNQQVQVTSLACPLFVPLVEEGWIYHPATKMIVKDSLQPLVEANLDCLILGCTHYPVLKSVIADILGPKVILVDSAAAVAEELRRLMGNVIAPAPVGRGQNLAFMVTDVADRFREVAKHFLDGLPVEQVEMIDL